MWFLRGHIPYRDYFSATPPLNTLKAALELKIFGPYLIVTRLVGVAERLLIAWVLFRWLCRLFPIRFAFVGSLVTVILSAGDMVDPIASYNHDAILWAMLSGFAASFVLDDSDGWKTFRYAAASGGFAGLCLITKQTVGIGAAIGVPFIVALILVNSSSYRKVLIWGGGFAAGCLVPVIALAVWLYHVHSWLTFLTMAFLKGPAAKGGHLSDFVRREMMVAGSNWFLVMLAVFAIAWSVSAILASERSECEAADCLSQWKHLRQLAVGFGVVILVAEGLAVMGLGALHNLSKISVYFVFILVSVFLVRYGVKTFRRRLTIREQQFALFCAVSFFVAFFLSLSWPAFEPMALPGLGLLIAAVLHGARPERRRYVYVVLGFLVFMQVLEKLNLPFGFDGLIESKVRMAVQPSKLPELRGMRLSPDMNSFLEQTVATIKTQTGPSDTIFTYPEMGLFYVLSDRNYPTLAASHNVDVVNDSFANEEAARLIDRRPAIVVYMKLTPEEVASQDANWRFGKPSGQHRLVAAVEALTSSYRVESIFKVGQGSREVILYRRP